MCPSPLQADTYYVSIYVETHHRRRLTSGLCGEDRTLTANHRVWSVSGEVVWKIRALGRRIVVASTYAGAHADRLSADSRFTKTLSRLAVIRSLSVARVIPT